MFPSEHEAGSWCCFVTIDINRSLPFGRERGREFSEGVPIIKIIIIIMKKRPASQFPYWNQPCQEVKGAIDCHAVGEALGTRGEPLDAGICFYPVPAAASPPYCLPSEHLQRICIRDAFLRCFCPVFSSFRPSSDIT